MWNRHVEKLLTRYCDGELSAADVQRVDAHLATCAACRTTLDEIRFSATLVRQLGAVSAPPSVWNAIDAALSPPQREGWFVPGDAMRWALACAVLLVVLTSVYRWTRDAPTGAWEVTRATDVAPRHMAAGDWVETHDGSTARIIVGQIGTVDVAPGSRVRLGGVSQSEYRLSLARGTISAEINAPPRLFIVDTPASTVVDLGCAYTVTVGDDGAGELRMTSGWASLELNGRESLVPAGAMCRTTPGTGPGTPYFEDATVVLKQAVDHFDAGRNVATALEAILSQARVRDTLTLWHLLSRVGENDRPRVYDRIAGFEPPPTGVSREQILALDPDALREWREELAWKW